jgi:hypothetical protein
MRAWSEERRARLRAYKQNLRDMAMAQGIALTEVDAGIQAARVLDNEEKLKAEACGMRGELPLVTKTPWNQGISFLFAHMTLPSACGPKPSPEELICSWDRPSADESALRDYLTRFHSGAFDRSHPLSSELVRLDAAGFGNRLADHLRQMFPAEMSAILGTLAMRSATGELPAPRTDAPAQDSLYQVEESSSVTWLVWCDERGSHKKPVSNSEYTLLEIMLKKSPAPKEDVVAELKIVESDYDTMQYRLNKKLAGWLAPFHFRGGSRQIHVTVGVYQPKPRQKKRQKTRQKRHQ